MFTGMIREVGSVRAVRRRAEGAHLELSCPALAAEAQVGDSLAVDGACLTAEEVSATGFSAFASAETLSKTTLGRLRTGSAVNLEPSLRLSDKLGGHLVQGHVEGVAKVLHASRTGEGMTLGVELPADLLPFLAPKGSLALAGVSLTVASLEGSRVEVAVVPHTLRSTTLGELGPGDTLNVETDLVARQVVAWLRGRSGGRRWTVEDLERLGY